MENVEIKKPEEKKVEKKVVKKVSKKLSSEEKRVASMTSEQKETMVEFMECRNAARAEQKLPLAYKEEEIAKFR